MINTLRRFAVALVAALVASGCGSMFVSPEAPQRTYWLDAAPVAASAAQPVAATLRVSLIPALDAERIWVLQQDGRLNYYAGAAWPDRLGRLLPDLIDRALPRPDASQGAYLDVVIEKFFAVQGSTDVPTSVELQALIRASQARSCRLTFNARPATGRLRDIAAAHQQVLDQLVAGLRGLAARAATDQPLGC